jgi:predicted transcriptional regulator of viral defense system
MSYSYTASMVRQLELVNTLAAEGHTDFTFQDALEVLGMSPTATANMLQRLTQNGLVDRVIRGHYTIRPLGSLGTSTVSEDIALAVGAAFEERLHRIAYRSALSELGLLTHPVRTLFVACEQQVRFTRLSGRPLRVIIERPQTIHNEADAVKKSWRSTLERALFECAMRLDLAGGVEGLAEALTNGASEVDARRITKLAKDFGARGSAAERRLASLASALKLPLTLNPVVDKQQKIIRLDPRDQGDSWIDPVFKVAWSTPVKEIQAVTGN